MKNIHILPTDKPSRLHLENSGLILCDLIFNSGTINSQNIYITNDEEIKEGEYGLSKLNEVVRFGKKFNTLLYKKIILTTDQDLIKDGVQAIDDSFLEWFIKNPSCEEVETVFACRGFNGTIPNLIPIGEYKIIIPKEEPKYPIGGYAPGYYECTCVTCKTQFQGDKRAVQCEPCAISMTKEEPKQTDWKESTKALMEAYGDNPKDFPYEEPKQETLNLDKLESKLDDALAKETKESLSNWLNSKRNKQETLEEVTKQIQNECHNFTKLVVPNVSYQDATNTFLFMKLAELTLKIQNYEK